MPMPVSYPGPNSPPRLASETEVIGVLSAGPLQHDHDTPANLLGRGQWRIYSALSFRSAAAFLRLYVIPPVIRDRDLTPGSWIQLLDEIQLLSIPPARVVTSPVADDYRWVEAPKPGACDVLAKPFYLTEVTRILSSAWLHWYGQHEGPIQSLTTVNA
jgi:DNA-binding NtrC family response regulator